MKAKNILALGVAVAGLTALVGGCCKKNDNCLEIEGTNASLKVCRQSENTFFDELRYKNEFGETVSISLCEFPKDYSETPSVCLIYIDDFPTSFEPRHDYFGAGEKAGNKWLEACKSMGCLEALQRKFPDLYKEPPTLLERL